MRGSAIAFLLLLLAATSNCQTYIGLSTGLRLDCWRKYSYFQTNLAIDLGSRVSKKSFVDVGFGYNSLSYKDIEKKDYFLFEFPTITQILTDEVFINTNLKSRFYNLRFQSNVFDSIPISVVIGINNTVALNQEVYRLISGSSVLTENVERLFVRRSSLNCGIAIDFELGRFKYSLVPSITYRMYQNYNYIRLPYRCSINVKLLTSLECDR
jgi:hypothetical protein